MAGTAPLKSLNAVTAPGNGITFDVQKARSDWEVQITTTGSPASFACHLEGAIDGVTFVTVGSSITATGLTAVTSNTPLTQVRLVLDSLTGGTAPTVTGVIVGDGPAGSGGGGGGGAATIADGADQAEGAKADTAATTDTGTFSLIALFKRLLQKFTTQFPAALGGTTAANSFAVALASDGTFATLSGAVTEAAPATDIASSGLNGRLQRIAQRLTSLIALFPTALGQTTAAASLPVTLATDGQKVGGIETVINATLTRPNNTNTYAAGDEITDTGGTIRTLSNMARVSGGSGTIQGVGLSISSNGSPLPSLELWIFDTTSTPQTDNAAFAPADGEVDTALAIIPLSATYIGTTGAGGNVFMDTGPINFPFLTVGSANLFLRVVVRNAYIAGAGSDTYKFRFRVSQD